MKKANTTENKRTNKTVAKDTKKYKPINKTNNNKRLKIQKDDKNEITFDSLEINDKLEQILKKSNFINPTEIQKKTIPAILNNDDVISIAKTGSGKTLCFVIPIISRLLDNFDPNDKLSALIISPTRELAVQTHETIKQLTKSTKIRSFNVIGGIKSKKESFFVENAQILVCTPGRLIQHFSELPNLRADLLDVLVLDEFDKMIELGFKEEISRILEYLPKTQRILISATFKHEDFSQEVVKLQEVKIFSDFSKNDVTNFYKIMRSADKINYLYSILSHISKQDNNKTIIFFSTCKAAKFHFLLFSKFFSNTFMLSSSVSQSLRMKNFQNFKAARSGILFCTDLGARGLDFLDVSVVIQFDCPESPETYIHRVGRTGRNGKSGMSYIFLLKNEERIIEFLKNMNLKSSGEIKQTEIEISEIESFPVKKLDKRLSGIFRNNKELRGFAPKYCETYEKVLNLNRKKFKVDVDEEISSLRKYLGVFK